MENNNILSVLFGRKERNTYLCISKFDKQTKVNNKKFNQNSKRVMIIKLLKGNVVPLTLLICALIGVFSFLIVHDISGMQNAETNYVYCSNLSNLVYDISLLYFTALLYILCGLTYINKQYSKWSIRLFYVLATSFAVYYLVAYMVFNYIVNHIDTEYIHDLSSLANTLFLNHDYFITIIICLIPKYIKDVMKLKEEQELTI